MTSLVKESWYDELIKDCQFIIFDGLEHAKETETKTYHALGERLLQDWANFERKEIYGKKIVKQVALSLKISERSLYYSIDFAKTYPKLEQLKDPSGKLPTWHRICNEILPGRAGASLLEHKHPLHCVCPSCGRKHFKRQS